VFLAAVCVLAALQLTGCRDASADSNELVVTGSTTILPIAETAAEMFTRDRDVKVLVSGVGSSAGIETVSAGSSDIGTSSRDLKDEEESLGLVDTPIAYDAIAVIVNPDNPVGSLTSEQIRRIFDGTITNWNEVGGDDRPIGLVNRDEASGTREAFFKIIMQNTPFDRTAVVLPGTGQVRSVVAESPGAIGYISSGFVSDEVKVLAVDGVVPSEEAILRGEYPVQRRLHFFTVGQPDGLAAEFIDYVLSDEVQHDIIPEAGFTPIGGGTN
jgi:phosphate transport system substrate-binding protein